MPSALSLSLNAAFVQDGMVLIVPEGVQLDRRVHVVHWSRAETAAASHVKHVIRLGRAAGATVIESFAGEGGYWSNVFRDGRTRAIWPGSAITSCRTRRRRRSIPRIWLRQSVRAAIMTASC
ncbi:MAG: hypothetical protein WDN69_21475 [Aliidongia sp.]